MRPAPHTLTLSTTKIADFPTLFKTEFRFLIPCLRHLTQNHTLCETINNIETLSYLIHWQSQNYLQLFKTKIDKIDTLIKTKIDKIDTLIKTKKLMIKSIACLRQKSTYPGWPHVPIKPYKGVPPPPLGFQDTFLGHYASRSPY